VSKGFPIKATQAKASPVTASIFSNHVQKKKKSVVKKKKLKKLKVKKTENKTLTLSGC